MVYNWQTYKDGIFGVSIPIVMPYCPRRSSSVRVSDFKGEARMPQQYYEPKDLKDFPNITEYAPAAGEKFFDYYSQATTAGHLTEREKSLIALAVATVRHCPYCIDAYTHKCLSLGLSSDEMMEAVHVGAAMTAGDVLAHATQMRKIIKKKEM
jgi:alkylhydroperoxidase/carboxymuconolactone decarboxylase family protein